MPKTVKVRWFIASVLQLYAAAIFGKISIQSSRLCLSRADVFVYSWSSLVGAWGGVTPRLCLVLQLQEVVVVLDIHPTTEGVHYPVEDREEAQHSPKKVQLEDCWHHCSFWNKLAAKREKNKSGCLQLGDCSDAFEDRFWNDLEHKCAHKAIRGFNNMALALE